MCDAINGRRRSKKIIENRSRATRARKGRRSFAAVYRSVSVINLRVLSRDRRVNAERDPISLAFFVAETENLSLVNDNRFRFFSRNDFSVHLVSTEHVGFPGSVGNETNGNIVSGVKFPPVWRPEKCRKNDIEIRTAAETETAGFQPKSNLYVSYIRALIAESNRVSDITRIGLREIRTG